MIIKGVAAYGLPFARRSSYHYRPQQLRGNRHLGNGVATGEDGGFHSVPPAGSPASLEATANVGDRAVVLHSIFGDEFDTSASTWSSTSPHTPRRFCRCRGQHPATFYKAMQSSETADQLIANSSALAGLTKAQIDGKHISLRAAIAPLRKGPQR